MYLRFNVLVIHLWTLLILHSDLLGLEWGLCCCSSTKIPGDAKAMDQPIGHTLNSKDLGLEVDDRTWSSLWKTRRK